MTSSVNTLFASPLAGGGADAAAAAERALLPRRRSSAAWWGPVIGALVTLVWLSALAIGYVNAVTIITLGGFAATLAGAKNPAIGLLGVGILSTIDPLTRVFLLSGGLLRWNTFNYVLILMMLIFLPRTLRLADRGTRFMAALLLLMCLQAPISDAPDVAFSTIINLVAAPGLLLFAMRAKEDPDSIIWLSLVCGLTSAVGGGIYFMQAESLPQINHNAWSAFPLTGITAICLAVPLTAARGHVQTLMVLLAGINACWVFISGSRGGMLISLVCLVYLLFQVRGRVRTQSLLLSVPLIAGLLFTAFAEQNTAALYRINKLFDSERGLESRTSGRSDIALAGYELFKQNPLGVGTGGFGPAFSQLNMPDISFRNEEKGSHSAWVKVAVENGVVGLVLLLAYVGSFFVMGIESRRPGGVQLGLLVTLVLFSAFFSREFQSKGLWLLAAGCTALYGAKAPRLYRPDILVAVRPPARPAAAATATTTAATP